jgi:transcriptional regulator with XRE-family HTH domain
MKFAAKLKMLREEKGLSKYALARLSGLTGQAISSLESGRNQPNWDTVQRLAAALGATCEAFAEGVQLPAVEPAKPRGRPRKDIDGPPPTKRKRK